MKDDLHTLNRAHAMGETFKPVEVNPEPCSDVDRDLHLGAFVSSFIVGPRRDRCLHIFVECPDKAAREFHQIDRWLDRRWARELKGAGFPRALQKAFESVRGVYFDGSSTSVLLTAAQAATVATQDSSDAILSLVAGRRALVFHHEGAVYLCERD